MRLSEQTRNIDRDVLATCRRQLGRNFVTLLCEGSRAHGDDLPDSDYDGMCYVRDVRRARLDLGAIRRKYGLRIGAGIKPVSEFLGCVSSRRGLLQCPNRAHLVAMKLGRARLVGGRDLLRLLPPASRLLPPDWKREAQRDYWLAILPVPCNVYRRESRRHVGFIIAICDSLLLAKRVVVQKKDLPAALRRHHPKFHAVGLLRRALRRRAVWPRLEHDRRTQREARADLDKFLAELRRYVFRGDGTDLTAPEARAEFMALWNVMK